MRRLGFTATLLLLTSVASGCSDGGVESAAEKRSLERSLELLQLTANYTPETADRQFQNAQALLSDPALTRYGKGILGAELAAAKALGRSQSFSVDREQITVESSEDGTVVLVPGTRVRTLSDGRKEELTLQYRFLLTHDVPPLITQLRIEELQSGGPDGAARPNLLMEQLQEASSAAKQERKDFVEAVKEVQEDLRQHEEKVEKSFERLSSSLDKLGGRVRQMGDEVRKLSKERAERAAAPAVEPTGGADAQAVDELQPTVTGPTAAVPSPAADASAVEPTLSP